MNSATPRHLSQVPDLRTDARVSLTKPPPVAARRRVAVRVPSVRPAVPVLRATAVHTGYGVAGVWRAGAAGWRWVVAAEYDSHLGTKPDLVERVRERRRKIALITSGV